MVLADGGLSPADNVTAILIAADVGLLAWFLRLRRAGWHRTLTRAVAVAAVLVFGAACTTGAWVPKSKPSKTRPVSTAHLAIVEPKPNDVVGPDFTLQLSLTGGRIVPATTTRLRPDEGHVHVSVGPPGQPLKLISMAYGLTQEVRGLSPGPYLIQAEFVASDHAPFKNRDQEIARVIIQVRST